MLVVRDDVLGGRIAVRNVLEALGHQTHPAIQNKDAGRVWGAACHIHQHRLPIQQGRRHAVAFHMRPPVARAEPKTAAS